MASKYIFKLQQLSNLLTIYNWRQKAATITATPVKELIYNSPDNTLLKNDKWHFYTVDNLTLDELKALRANIYTSIKPEAYTAALVNMLTFQEFFSSILYSSISYKY